MHSSSRLFHGLDNGRYHDGDGEPFLRGPADWSNPTTVQECKIIERFACGCGNKTETSTKAVCKLDSRPINNYTFIPSYEKFYHIFILEIRVISSQED